jgi:ABC-type amino acid transport substrate-binding protein
VLARACATPPSQQAALTRIAQSQVLTLGFREDSKPFSFRGPDGTPAGYTVELCKRMAASLQAQLKLAKLDVKWVPVTVATRMQAVNDGSVDVECGSTSRTLGREQLVDFSNPIWVDGSSFVSPDTAPLRAAPICNGKRVGVIPGTTTEAALKALAARGIVPVLRSGEDPHRRHGRGARRPGRSVRHDRLILVGEVLGGPAGRSCA